MIMKKKRKLIIGLSKRAIKIQNKNRDSNPLRLRWLKKHSKDKEAYKNIIKRRKIP